jgi:fumarylacetoacetate (FAA) hydrolase
MRFVRFADRSGQVACGVVRSDEIEVIPFVTDLRVLLETGGDALPAAAALAHSRGGRADIEDIICLSPIGTPGTIRDFYAFEQHVQVARAARGLTMDADWYDLPVFYFSNPYAATGCGDVPIPPGSRRFDFELEVAAIIGRPGSNLSPLDADGVIAGVCVMNDWSARDTQAAEMKQSLGPVKGKDTATSLGPYLVTPDEIADFKRGRGYDLKMRCTVNGREYSSAVWSDVYWSFGEMIAYASRGTDVRAGDVIGSGTCGTGCILELAQTHGVDRFPWLNPGDEVVASLDQLGSLHNRVVRGADPLPLRPTV